MSIKKFNKTTAAVLAGAIVTVIASFYVMDAELQGAVQTLITAALVFLVPNSETEE